MAKKSGESSPSRPRTTKGSERSESSRKLSDSEWRGRVACKAYELFEARGGEPGHDVEDWLEAEKSVQEELARASQSAVTRNKPGRTVGRERGSRTASNKGDTRR